jgi:hypothetical protein
MALSVASATALLFGGPAAAHADDETVVSVDGDIVTRTEPGLVALPPLPKPKDFNRDGNSDLLWHNAESGLLSIWFLNGSQVIKEQFLSWKAPESSGWKVVGTGDFNGDGRCDVLLHNGATGVVSIWYLDGANGLGYAALDWTSASSSGWKVVGTGDFNGDRRPDVLWYHPASGQLSVWFVNTAKVTGSKLLSWTTPESSGWKVVGTGDFNGDGYVDVLWHHPASGQVNTWLLHGVTVIANPSIDQRATEASGWFLQGTGDYNRDGKTDLVWHHPASGAVSTWLLDGTHVIGYRTLNWLMPAANDTSKIVSR